MASNQVYTKSIGALNGALRLFVRGNSLSFQSSAYSLYPRNSDLNLTIDKTKSNGINATFYLNHLNDDKRALLLV